MSYLRLTLSGAGRAVVAFATEATTDALEPARSFGLALDAPRSVALVPVGSFASWQWSGRIRRITVRGDGSRIIVESMELLDAIDR